MAFYRCYLFNSEQHILKAWSLSSDDVEEVITRALTTRDESTWPIVEVWTEDWCVYRDDCEVGLAAKAG